MSQFPSRQTYQLDIEAVPQSRPRVTKRGNVYYGKRTTTFRRDLTFLLGALHKHPPFECPVAVEITVSKLRKSADLDNVAKAVLDSAVDAGVLASDNAQVVQSLTIRYDDAAPDLLLLDIIPLEYKLV